MNIAFCGSNKKCIAFVLQAIKTNACITSIVEKVFITKTTVELFHLNCLLHIDVSILSDNLQGYDSYICMNRNNMLSFPFTIFGESYIMVVNSNIVWQEAIFLYEMLSEEKVNTSYPIKTSKELKEILAEHEMREMNIIFAESDNHRVLVHFDSTTNVIPSIYASLNIIEKILPEYMFIRVHQSYLVNAQFIKQMNNYTVILKTGKHIKCSKKRYSLAKEKYKLFQSLTRE